MPLLAQALLAAAAVAGARAVLAAPTPTSSSAACTVTAASGFASCASSANIVIQGPFTVPAETTVDLSGLSSGASVTVSGTVTWAKSTGLTKDDYLFTLGGAGVTFDGSAGVFDGNGQDYWDGEGSNGGVPKPKFFKVKTTANSVITGLTILNSPVHVFSISGSNTTLDGITVDDSAGDDGGGHNTDAFDVSASNIIIKNSVVHNQDDCLAVNSGSNIQFIGNTCVGGHGISIGSIASDKTVDTVTVKDCVISDSQNGVRIKTVYDATDGYVKNVEYSGITLSGITKYGIVIEQDYENGSPTGTPTDGIPISAVTLTNITGSLASGAKHSVYILCAACTDFDFSEIAITGSSASCSGVSPLPEGCTSSTSSTSSTKTTSSSSTKVSTSSTNTTSTSSKTSSASSTSTLVSTSKTTTSANTADAAAASSTSSTTLLSTITSSASDSATSSSISTLSASTSTSTISSSSSSSSSSSNSVASAVAAYLSQMSSLSAEIAEDLAIETAELAEISSYSAKLATETDTAQISHEEGRMSKAYAKYSRASADATKLHGQIASLESLLATKTA
ncbi:hypothetical protein HK405_013256 [Cladochytrium tenue]|nr:hypothetical protein HK405_013256 [Cladochytrium tenue]